MARWCLVVLTPLIQDSSPQNCLCSSVKDWLYLCACFWTFSSVPLICLSVPSPIPHCLHYKQYTQEVKFNGETVFASSPPPQGILTNILVLKKIFFNINKFVNRRNRKPKRKCEQSVSICCSFDKLYKRTEIIKTYLSHKEYEILR